MVKWPTMPADRDERGKLVLFLTSAFAAVLLGFVLVSPDLGGRLITRGGYYYILCIFAAWLFFAWRVAKSLQVDRGPWLRRHWAIIGFLIAATAFAVWTDSFSHKLLFDDYVLQGTAWHMHVTKEIQTPVRAYDFAGTWLDINTFLDKRPYFFPFLLSLVHDLTGFRVANVFALNVAFAFLILASLYWVVEALTQRRSPAFIAVSLLATLPLFGQNATGASMELLNLAMIAIHLVTATLYLREPSPDRLSLLALGTILLAQTRYESVLFVLPIASLIVLGWF